MNFPDLDTLWDYQQPAASEQKFRALLPQARANPLYELELLTQIARAQGLQGQFAQAHQTLDGVEARLTLGTAVARLRYWLERGRVFNSSGQPDQARPLFEQAWTLAQQIGEHGYAVDAAHMLGLLEAPAQTWNERALRIAVNSRDPRARRWLGSLYNNMGWSYHNVGKYDQALEFIPEGAACLRGTGAA